MLGAGTIEDVRVQRDKGFGFVRYSTHAEAALAIQMGNARIMYGKPIKVYSYDGFFFIDVGFCFPFFYV
jgi:RNA recognition motif-containing protein